MERSEGEDPDLVTRLRGRRLLEWLFAYVAGAWILLELTDFLVGHFDGPEAVVGVLLTALAFGLLAAIVVAWYHGERGRQEVTRPELALLSAIAGAGILATVWVGATSSWGPPPDALEAELRNRGTPLGMGARDALAQVSLTDPREAPLALAVLPFLTLDPGGEGEGGGGGEAFADGVTEDLLFELSLLPGLRVLSRTTTAAFRGTDLGMVEIGRLLDVDLVLEGSVRRAGDRTRIVAQLIDARSDEHLWSGAYDRDLVDLLAVQAEVAAEIAQAISGLLEPEVEVDPATPWPTGEARSRGGVRDRVAGTAPLPTLDPETTALLFEGRRMVRSPDPDTMRTGTLLLLQVLERHPGLESARTGLAELLERGGVAGGMRLSAGTLPPPPPPELRTRVREALSETERPEAATRPGRSQAWRVALDEGEVEVGEAALVRILQANPNDAQARYWYGVLLASTGRGEAALEQLRVARALNPGASGAELAEAALLSDLGRAPEALATLERALSNAPAGSPPALHLRAEYALVLAALGRRGDALREARALAAEHPAFPPAWGTLGEIEARGGARAAARTALVRLEELGDEPSVMLARAQVHAALGEGDAAREALGQAARASGWVALSTTARRLGEGVGTPARPPGPGIPP